MVAATDSRHFVDLSDNVYRFNPVRTAAADLPWFHGVDERIPVAGYSDAIRFYRQLILNAGP
jgi:carboxypeptidase PM20D1